VGTAGSAGAWTVNGKALDLIKIIKAEAYGE
jgi:hypothetical protein